MVELCSKMYYWYNASSVINLKIPCIDYHPSKILVANELFILSEQKTSNKGGEGEGEGASARHNWHSTAAAFASRAATTRASDGT
jgi:hypothetical protein